MAKLSSFSLVALIVATFILYLPSILSIRPVALLAAGLLIGGAFLSGFFLINRASPRRSVLGFGTAQRNIAAATVVAQTFDDSGVLVMVVVTSLIDLAVLFPIAWVLRYRGQRKPPDQIQLRRTA